MGEKDVISIETTSRSTIRILNFIELLLQAFHNLNDDPATVCAILSHMSRAVKASLQIQIGLLCNVVLFRRDHFISAARGLSKDQIIALRTGSFLGLKGIFDDKLLSEINVANKDALNARAMSRIASGRVFKSTGRGDFGDYNKNRSDNQHFRRGARVSGISRGGYVCTDQVSNNVVRSFSPVSYDWSVEKEKLAELQLIPVGGRLLHTAHLWKSIGASNKVCRWLRRGYRLPFRPGGEDAARSLFSLQSVKDRMASYAAGSEKAEALSLMIDTLLRKNAIVQMTSAECGFFNLVFLRPKKHDETELRLDKRWRLILDVSELNKFIVAKKITMETVQKIRQTIMPGLFATSIDLTDAYHHIPIHPNFQNFLAFQVADRKFKYVAMPFGLSSAPQVFTEVMTPIKIFARENFGGYVFQYIDDWLLLDRSPLGVLEMTKKFVNLCIRQGMVVNLDKSHLTPATELTHLGTRWDFQTGTVAVPQDRVEAIIQSAGSLVRQKRALIGRLESLMGTLVSCEKLVPFGRINFRSFQRTVVWNLRFGRRPRFVSLRADAIRDLVWWNSRLNISRPVPFIPPKHDVMVYTDASDCGWGAFTEDWSVSGRWSAAELFLHINHRELLAVLKALREKTTVLRDRVVLFLIDNTTTVAYILKQGGTRSPGMTETCREIFRLAADNSISLLAKHIKGSLNVLADFLSRPDCVVKTEWSLSQENFMWVCAQSPWGPPTIDLFANRFNHQLDRYFSPCPDEQAVATDALVASWPFEVTYAFPPTTLMSEVVQKLQQERPERLVLVAPDWPNVTWNSTLRSLAWKWRPIPYVSLLQPMSRSKHPHPHTLSLAVWLISYSGSPIEVIPPLYFNNFTGLVLVLLTLLMSRSGSCFTISVLGPLWIRSPRLLLWSLIS